MATPPLRPERAPDDPWERVSVRGVPAPVAAALEGAGLGAAECRACLASRLRLDGRFGRTWLAVGPERLRVVAEEAGGARLLDEVALGDVTAARAERSTAGGGALVVEAGGPARTLVRYDAGGARAFGRLARRLDRAARPAGDDGGDDGAGPLDLEPLLAELREGSCPRCGRPYPRRTRVCPACVRRGSVLRRVLGFARPYRGRLVLLGGLMVLGTGLQLVPPQIVRILIDDVLPTRDGGALGLAVLALGVVMAGQAGLTIARSRLAVAVGSRVTDSVRRQAFQHLTSLSLGYFDRQETGALMARVNNDTRQMQGFLVDGIQYTVVNVLLVVGILAALLWMNPFLGLLVLVPVPFVVVVSAVVWRRIRRRFHVLWRAWGRLSAYLGDALNGVRVIKAFGQEAAEQRRFGERAERYRRRLVEAESTWQTLVPLLNLLVQSSLLLIWYFGAFEVWGGRLTVGSLIAYVSYLGLIYGPLQLLTRLNDWMSRALTAAARVFEVLDTPPAVREAEAPRALPECAGRVELRGVTFGYEPHEPVLKELDLEVRPGEMVGLVGRSGAGKSTLINLVGRLYDVDEGSVRLDGVDVRELRLDDLRRQVGYVLQETFLFNGTVAENVAYGRPDAGREALIEAAVAANAHGFVMALPDAYDTVVGERGAKLSGGERQRIAIARALLQDPRVLILDEATSSVDTETEAKIQDALARLVQGRTTIAIAHRLSTLRHADRLVVIDDGRVVEEGSHDDLMALEGGTYRRLVEIQTEWSRTIGVGG